MGPHQDYAGATDEQLIQWYREAGDQEGFDELLKRYMPTWRCYCARRVSDWPGQQPDLESAFGERFLKCVQSYTPAKGRFTALVSVAMGHCLNDFWRRYYSKQRKWERQAVSSVGGGEELERLLEMKEVSEAPRVSPEMAALLEKGMHGLCERDVRIVKLFIDPANWSWEEVAGIMSAKYGLSANGAKSAYRRAVKKLLKSFGNRDNQNETRNE